MSTDQPARRPVTSVRILGLRQDRQVELPDDVVTEEPMEIRVAGPGQAPAPVAVTMRTPGHDFDLAVGFLLAEGVLASPADVDAVRYCDLPADQDQLYNVVTVSSRRAVALDGHQRRHTVTAACGICGSTSLDDLEARCPSVAPDGPGGGPSAEVLLALPDRLRSAQRVFDRTGGLHGAGLFSYGGDERVVREDIGRHNAVDKLVGWAALAGRLPLAGHVLVVSGRVSFEIVQKAAVAGIPVVVAVSAPSSLAVASAQRLGITLVGFARDGRGNVYSEFGRVRPGP